ncbi:MAG: hypothetical protein ACM3TR_10995 [Caulobacteraceae bacterium]
MDIHKDNYRQCSIAPYIVESSTGESICICHTDEKAELIVRALNLMPGLADSLKNIERICEEIDRDADEPDKVMCGTGRITLETAKAYPKHLRTNS